MNGPLLFGALLFLGIMLLSLGGMFALTARDPVDARLQLYGVAAELAGAGKAGRRAWPLVTRLLTGFGLGQRLAGALARADVPLTAAEFALVMAGFGLLGLLVGLLRNVPLMGLVLAAGLACLPLVYLNLRQGRRLRAFTEQLPDVITLLVGALRAGQGFSQAMQTVVDQSPQPASVEFGRVVRAIGLGLSMTLALNDMAERMRSDDLDLVVTAINIQNEMGGNLAQTLATIASTVRDRIRIKRQIRVFTAQQRFSSYILSGLPLLLGVIFYLISPSYMARLFEPDRIVIPILAAVFQIVGFLVIRRVVDIEV